MLQGRHEDKAAKSSTFFWHFCFSQLSPTFLHFQTSGTKYYLYWIQLHALQLKVPARSPKREAGEFSREAVGCSARSRDHCEKGNADFGATGWKGEGCFDASCIQGHTDGGLELPTLHRALVMSSKNPPAGPGCIVIIGATGHRVWFSLYTVNTEERFCVLLHPHGRKFVHWCAF